MATKSKFIFPAIILINLICGLAYGQVVYVKAGATGSGATWSDATGNLQAAINTAATMVLGKVRVAQGIYTPGNNQSDTFVLSDAVSIRGGYFGTPGTELDANARDPNPATNNTVLSGEIGSPGFGDNIITIVSGNVAGITDQLNTLLDGFTITGADRHAIDLIGNNSPTLSNLNIVANGDPSALSTTDFAGAGLTMGGGSRPIVESCLFSANVARAGAAVDIPGGRPIFNNCRFESNAVAGPPVGPFRVGGGAVRAASYESAFDPASGVSVPTTFRNCTFHQNESIGGSGGAILKTGQLHLLHCAFTENSAAGAGYDGNGGALASESPKLVMHDCDFGFNHVTNVFRDPSFTFCGGSAWWSDKEEVEVVCCRFFGNVCADLNPNQGAVALNFTSGTLTNLTVADNTAPGFGGVIVDPAGAGPLT